MKKLSYYVALALAAGLWGCNQGQLAQKGEYDDLYFSSKDKEQVLTASASQEPVQYNNSNAGDNQDQQDVNPDYSNQNVQSNRRNGQADVQGGDTYYDENYTANQDRRFGNIRPNYNYNNVGGGNFAGNYSYYDPFFSDTFYDPYFARSPYFYDTYYAYGPAVVVRPRVNVIIGPSWGWGWGGHYGGWGWNHWNRWGGGWYDPFWGPSWGYSAWYGPSWGGYYGPGWGGYYGGGLGWYGNSGWNRGYYGNNGYSRNNETYGNYAPRSGRGGDRVNGRLDNSVREDGNNGGGRTRQASTSEGVATPGRAARPARGASSDTYRSETATEDYSRGRSRTNSNPDYSTGRSYPSNTPATRPAEESGISRPRPVRPSGGSDYPSGDNNQRTYDYSNRRSTDYYNNNSNSSNDSRPSYSTPTQRYENRNNDSYNNRSNDSRPSYDAPRPSRSYDNGGGYNSGGRSSSESYSSPRSSGGNSGGSSSGSSGGGSGRAPRPR